jgi:hypothetical protein
MDRTTIIATLRANAGRIRARGVTHLAVFGSRARNEGRDDSDLDVLVDIDPALPKFSLIDLAGVSRLVSEITGHETVAVERHMAEGRPGFAERIASDLIEVF